MMSARMVMLVSFFLRWMLMERGYFFCFSIVSMSAMAAIKNAANLIMALSFVLICRKGSFPLHNL